MYKGQVTAALLLAAAAACMVTVAAQCSPGSKPNAPRAEVVQNSPTHGDLAGIVLKVWNPVAEGRGGACVREIGVRVTDPSLGRKWEPSISIKQNSDCNPCYYTHTAVRGSKVTFRFQARDAESTVDSTGRASDDTTITVAAAGTAPSRSIKHENDGFLALPNHRVRSDRDYDIACSGTAPGVSIDAAALKNKVCRVCGGLDNIMKYCKSKVFCKGFEIQEGQDCAVLKFPGVPYEYPAAQAAPGWTAYILGQGWQEKCDGCYS